MDQIAEILTPIATIVVALVVCAIVFRVTNPKHQRALSLDGLGMKLGVTTGVQTVSTASISDGSADETQPPESREKLSEVADQKPASAFWTAKNLPDESEYWDRFKEEASYKSDPDFWTSLHFERRIDLGDIEAKDHLSNLTSSEPTWIWPLIIMADHAKKRADYDLAETYLERARERPTASTRDIVLARSIHLRRDAAGLSSATTLAHKLTKGASPRDRAAVFSALAESIEKNGSLIAQIYREASVRAHVNHSRQFDLAYSYAENSDTAALSLRHYAGLVDAYYNLGSTSNNLAVQYGRFGSDALKIQNYEISIENGNPLAACNLAHELVNSGFIAKAKSVLSLFADYSEHEENKANIDAKIASASREMDKRRSEIRETTLSYFNKVQGFLTEFENYWSSSDELSVQDGNYVHETTKLTLANGEVRLSMDFDGKRFSSNFIWLAPAAEGWISEEAASIISAIRRRILLVSIGSSSLALLVLPIDSSGAPIVQRLKREIS